MRDECPLCTKRISDWEAAGGKTVIVNGKVVHKACLMDKTTAQVEAAIR